MERDRLTICIMALFVVGCLLDHLTTSYGLDSPAYIEKNPLINMLLERGIWQATEILIVTIGVGLGLHSLNQKSGKSSSLYFGMMALAGFVRLIAGFQNVGIILQFIA